MAKELRTAKNDKEKWQRVSQDLRMKWTRLQSNQPFIDGVLTYAEVKNGLLMGSTIQVQDQMKRVIQDNDDLQAENTKLRGDVERLTWYHNAESVEDEMEIAEGYASDDE